MTVTIQNIKQRLGCLTLTALMSATLSSCGSVNSSEKADIKIDGSSTVYPISQKVIEEFKTTQVSKETGTLIDNKLSGTTDGFDKFCQGETDINNASRPIHEHEMKACSKAGVRYVELMVGLDGVVVVVNKQNNWAKDITLEELKKIWEPQAEGKITRWNQIRPSWPDRPINLYGPGRDSGTFDYFTEAVVGQEYAIRKDYKANKDPQLLAQDVMDDPNALGYFGYGYYNLNKDNLNALAVGQGDKPVLPSYQTIKSDQYRKLSRPLFLYVNMKASQDKPLLREFVYFYLDNAPEFVSASGYVPLPKDGYKLGRQHFEIGKAGTVFEGKSQIDLTMNELLRKQAVF